eukprot:11663324-Alexandrium_andersonii.AAC.1
MPETMSLSWNSVFSKRMTLPLRQHRPHAQMRKVDILPPASFSRKPMELSHLHSAPVPLMVR